MDIMSTDRVISVLRPDDKPHTDGISYVKTTHRDIMNQIVNELELYSDSDLRTMSFTNDMTIWYSADYNAPDSVGHLYPINTLAYRLVTFLNGRHTIRGPVVVTGKRRIALGTVEGLSKTHVQLLNILRTETVSSSLSLTAQRDALPIDMDNMFQFAS